MQYRAYGSTGFDVSPLGFGMMRLPSVKEVVDENEAIRILRYAIDHGVNYVDTAYVYHGGASELVTGKALKDGYREKVKIATKLPTWMIRGKESFEPLLDEQLKKLGVEQIDYYLLHGLDLERWTDVILKNDILTKMEQAKASGKIGAICFSFHDVYDSFIKIVDGFDKWDMCQIQLNYLDTEYQAGIKGLKYAASKGIAVVAMEPLLGGKLANLPPSILKLVNDYPVKRTPVEWALDWLWDQPEISTVLSGMSSFDQVAANVSYAETARVGMFSDADREFVKTLQREFEKTKTIPCTRCAYCMPCPNGVDIPGNFAAYNAAAMFEDLPLGKEEYKNMIMFGGPNVQASSCISCRVCEDVCPQHIVISERLAEVKDLLAG